MHENVMYEYIDIVYVCYEHCIIRIFLNFKRENLKPFEKTPPGL